jgi:hypothetical protein
MLLLKYLIIFLMIFVQVLKYEFILFETRRKNVYIDLYFLKINIPKFNQRRLCMVKYLGEMYNYRVVDSIIIFRTLYLLITYGVNLESKYFFYRLFFLLKYFDLKIQN